MRSLSKPFALILALTAIFAAIAAPALAQSQQPGGRVVLVLPFDNRSGNPSLNWVGDSFPDTLSKRLTSAGFLTISHDDRSFAYDHLGLPTDFRSDIYSMAVVAYSLVCGVLPFGGKTSGLIEFHRSGAPEPPARIAKAPGDVSDVVLSGLARQPGDRPPSAIEFARVSNSLSWKR